MKELYFTLPYRRSKKTVRLEYGQVKKKFIVRPMTEKSMVEELLKVLRRKKYLMVNRRC